MTERPTPLHALPISRRTVLKAGALAGTAVAAQSVFGWPGRPEASATTPPPLPFDFVNDPPFSFVYDGVPSSTLLPTWSPTSSTTVLYATRTQQTVTWTGTYGLRVTCVAVIYSDFPVVEWTVHFANTGSANTRTLEDVLAIDTVLQGAAASSWTVHTNSGSNWLASDFEPAALTLSSTPGQYKLFSNAGGRSTSGSLSADPLAPGGAWPYYNLDWGSGGAIVALAWPGQWGLQMGLAPTGEAPVIGGMTNKDSGLPSTVTLYDLQLMQTYLTPGETMRTPMIVTMAWSGGDWNDAQNQWRGWMLAYNTPRPGNAVPAPVCATAGTSEPTLAATQATLADYQTVLGKYHANGLTPAAGGHIDWFWIDSGWYELPAGVNAADTDAWTYTGTWNVDAARYPASSGHPNGLAELTDDARADGMRAIVWHEPERCRPGTWLYGQTSWLLADGNPDHRYLNWGVPAALSWAVSTFNTLISTNGVDLFRIDFNFTGPLPNWNATDGAGRRGATQALWVAGFLAFLDAIRAANPGILIDNCASGGRRLDLETLRRCVVFSRSDFTQDNEANQSQNGGLSSWVVCQGSSSAVDSLYALRSGMGWEYEVHLPGLVYGTATPAQWSLLKAATDEWATLSDNYLGDFYPLLYRAASDTTHWAAHQFHRPDLGHGMLQAFARAGVPVSTSLTVALRGLVPTGHYEAWDVDHPGTRTAFLGSDLMTAGVNLAPTPRPYAVTVRYERVS
jgi:alpha-galactosidase